MFHSSTIAAGHRPFFAIRPPIALARQIVAASAWLGGDMLTAERLHITLLILDDLLHLPPALIETLRDLGRMVSAAPIAITLDRLLVTNGWAALRPSTTNARLRELYGQLARLARAAAIAERRDHQFNAHLTLGYHAAMASNGRVRPMSWTAGELLLLDSHLGRTKHQELGRWPLNGTDPQLALF